MPRKKAQTWETEQAIFPSKLSELMKERKVSQETLANAIGVKRQTVSLYKTGQSSPSADQLCKIAKFFNVSADWLLGLSEAKSPDNDIQQICKQTGIREDIVKLLCIYSRGKQNGPSDSQLIDNFNTFLQGKGRALSEFLEELNWYAKHAKSVEKSCHDIRQEFEVAKEEDYTLLCPLDEWGEQLSQMIKEIRFRRFECIDSLTKRFDAAFNCDAIEKLLQETLMLVSDAIEDDMWCCE